MWKPCSGGSSSPNAGSSSSIELWTNSQPGYSNPQAWQNMAQLMTTMALLPELPDVTKAFSNDYLPH